MRCSKSCGEFSCDNNKRKIRVASACVWVIWTTECRTHVVMRLLNFIFEFQATNPYKNNLHMLCVRQAVIYDCGAKFIPVYQIYAPLDRSDCVCDLVIDSHA